MRAWVQRQWPVGVVLAALVWFDLDSFVSMGTARWGWVVPVVAATAVLALVAPVRPVAVAVGAALTVAVWSVVLRVAGAESVGGLTVTEIGALAIVVVVVVRQLAPRTAAGLVALVVACGVTATRVRPDYWAAHGGTAPETWWSVSLSGVLLTVLPVASGWWLRGRDRQRERAARAAEEAAQQAERLELAGELHEALAYQVGVMVTRVRQAQTATVTDPGAAAQVLPLVERSGMEALAAMRRLVAELRDDTRAPAAASTVDLAPELRALESAGRPAVRMTLDLAEPVGDEVAPSVLRLVREAVADARQGAGVREIAAAVRTGPGGVRVEVRDDGRARPADGPGPAALRERVRLLGGRFSAGRAPGGGWLVTADVPLDPPRGR